MRSMQPLVLTFAFDDGSQAGPASPARVALTAMRDFTREVEDFLRGDDKEVDVARLNVAVVDGSFGLRTEPIALAPMLVRDLGLLASSQTVDAVSERRRNVVLTWQKRARSKTRWHCRIEAPFMPGPLRIDASTDFRANDADQWVVVERYMRGEVFEIGGQHTVNVHIRLADGQPLHVDATKDQLRDDRSNRLYKQAMVRFRADYNVITGKYRNARLIAFTDYSPQFDAKSFERLTQRGAEAWRDVADATAWVETLRGD
jgi:hypothetical protein